MGDSARTDTRLVPMTREEREWLAALWIEYLGNPNPCPLVAAWDAAPANPTEAAKIAGSRAFAEVWRSEYPSYGGYLVVDAVLRALGHKEPHA